MVGASGRLIDEIIHDGKKTVRFVVDDVIDFAWTASPKFVQQTTTWNNTDITLLTYPDHAHFADRYFTTIKGTMDYMAEHFMPYPYETLTIVDPPIHGIFTGGMEYPTFISSLSFCFFPTGVKTPETLVVHEFVHQYFMQMVATNEYEEPWMDEGITTYYEGRIRDHQEGKHTSTINWMGITAGNAEFNRAEYFNMKNPKIASNAIRSSEYIHGGYGEIAYNKAALWLETLEGLIGTSTMDDLMKTYFDRWKFKHPCRNDFIDIANEVVKKHHGDALGDNLNWFFDQVLFGTDICDYAVASVENREINPPFGYLNDTTICKLDESADGVEKNIRSEVILHRLGGLQFPVEIDIIFDNGDVIREYWDGRDRSKSFVYSGPSKMISAEIDPDRKITIDANFLNNSYAVKPHFTGLRKYLSQYMMALQHVMLTLGTFI